ncbi:MAG: hypothetical protein ABEJ91_00415 [Candidatus Nanohaloarchaea archaeon]
MEKLVHQLREIEGVKAVRRRTEEIIEVEPFSQEVEGRDHRKIPVDLRKVTPKIKSALDNAKGKSITSWRLVETPEKRYRDRSPSESVSDREPLGYRPWKYVVEIET